MKQHLERSIPCGCKLCGCQCEVHSRAARANCDDPLASLCPVHACDAVLRAIAHEAGALVSLALFCGMIAVWAVVLHG